MGITVTASLATAEEARSVAESTSGPVLVLAQETLEQIRAAEEAGGFEGGMSGGGEGGSSAPGEAGPNSSSSTDVAPLPDLDGAVGVAAFFENGAEKALDLKDLLEAIGGTPVGPVILVPISELRRLLGIPTDGDGA